MILSSPMKESRAKMSFKAGLMCPPTLRDTMTPSTVSGLAKRSKMMRWEKTDLLASH